MASCSILSIVVWRAVGGLAVGAGGFGSVMSASSAGDAYDIVSKFGDEIRVLALFLYTLKDSFLGKLKPSYARSSHPPSRVAHPNVAEQHHQLRCAAQGCGASQPAFVRATNENGSHHLSDKTLSCRNSPSECWAELAPYRYICGCRSGGLDSSLVCGECDSWNPPALCDKVEDCFSYSRNQCFHSPDRPFGYHT